MFEMFVLTSGERKPRKPNVNSHQQTPPPPPPIGKCNGPHKVGFGRPHSVRPENILKIFLKSCRRFFTTTTANFRIVCSLVPEKNRDNNIVRRLGKRQLKDLAICQEQC